MSDRRDTSVRVPAARALSSIEEHGLLPTPETYAVWFAYHAETHPQLNADLRESIARRQPIDDDRCRALYDRYLGSRGCELQLERACGRLDALAGSLLSELAQADIGTARYASTLDKLGCSASGGGQPLVGLVRSIVEETAAIRDQLRHLGSCLADGASRIGTLRNELLEAWRDARTDPVTGLANRHHFEHALRQSAAKAVDHGTEVALAMIAVDEPGARSDRRGRRVVESALRLVALPLRGVVRPHDTAARYGCRELALIMQDLTLQAAFRLVDRLRSMLASRELTVRSTGESLGRVTISLGLTSYRRGEPIDQWVDRASAALEEAQRAGANRIIAVAAPPTPRTPLQP